MQVPDSKFDKLLIIDIDETMIHTVDERDPIGMKAKYQIMVNQEVINVNIRPHLMDSLHELKQSF